MEAKTLLRWADIYFYDFEANEWTSNKRAAALEIYAFENPTWPDDHVDVYIPIEE